MKVVVPILFSIYYFIALTSFQYSAKILEVRFLSSLCIFSAGADHTGFRNRKMCTAVCAVQDLGGSIQ